MICIYTHLHAFASLIGVSPLLLSLKYITYSFSACSLSVPSLLPCLLFVPLLHRSPRRKAIRVPLSSLPSLRLSSRCLLPCVPWLPWLPCVSFRLPVPCSVLCVRALEAPRRPSVCPSVCRAACPSLVSHQAQDGVAVWADTPRICSRPFVLLPMCCRVSRCPFRVLSCGFLPCARVCVLLPCVVWW